MKTRFVTRSELRYSIRCLEHALTERNVYVRDLEASLAAAGRRAEEADEHWREANLKAADVRAERDAWREQALSAASPEEVSESHDNWMYRAKGAERRLAIAKEALGEIAGRRWKVERGDSSQHPHVQQLRALAREALAALDGEGEAE